MERFLEMDYLRKDYPDPEYKKVVELLILQNVTK